MNIKSARGLEHLKTEHTARRAVAGALQDLTLRQPAKDAVPDSALNREERRMRKKLRRRVKSGGR